MNERHQLEEKLQYKFHNKKLLMTAVTHSSYVKEHCHEEKSNERLEFLGDAFFDAIIGEKLFHIFPQEEEVSCRVSGPRSLLREISRAGSFEKAGSGTSVCSSGNGEAKSGRSRTRASTSGRLYGSDHAESSVYLDGEI